MSEQSINYMFLDWSSAPSLINTQFIAAVLRMVFYFQHIYICLATFTEINCMKAPNSNRGGSAYYGGMKELVEACTM